MSLNIGGKPVRKIYWGADEIKEVRQGSNMVFVPSVVVYTYESSNLRCETASLASGAINIANSSPDPIDVTVYKRLKVRVSLTPTATFNSSSAELSLSLILRTPDGSVAKTIELGGVTCTADTVGTSEFLLTFPDDFNPGETGTVALFAMNFKFYCYGLSGETKAKAVYEFEAIC